MSHEAIAQALKIDPKTLRKHYEAELASGANLRRVMMLETLFSSGRKGNVSAAREYLKHAPQFEALTVPQSVVPEPAREPKRGKKEQAQVDAVGAEAGTDWDGILPGNNVVAIR